VSGATGFKLYKTAAGGAVGTELLYKTVGLVTTDIDTTPGTPTGAFPVINTAGNSGIYVPPAKFFPVQSTNLGQQQATIWRRGIRQTVDTYGAVPGNENIAGDLELEFLPDVIPYFMMASRLTVVRTGTSPNFVYTATPANSAMTSTTLSITEIKNNQVFGYTGLVVSSYTITVNDGVAMYRASLIGGTEATQTDPTEVYSATSVPIGAGQWDFKIPDTTAIFDVDTFEFQVEDNGEPQFRLKSNNRGAQWVKFGARNATLSFDRDFPNRAEFDLYKALTPTTVKVSGITDVNTGFDITLPKAIRNSYEVPLGGQGDVIRARQELQAVFDTTVSRAFQLIVRTQEVVT
jgi:hypothetical protein